MVLSTLGILSAALLIAWALTVPDYCLLAVEQGWPLLIGVVCPF